MCFPSEDKKENKHGKKHISGQTRKLPHCKPTSIDTVHRFSNTYIIRK